MKFILGMVLDDFKENIDSSGPNRQKILLQLFLQMAIILVFLEWLTQVPLMRVSLEELMNTILITILFRKPK